MRTCLALLLLGLLAVPAFAQEKPKLALQVEVKAVSNYHLLLVTLENRGDAAIMLDDVCVPAYYPYMWLRAEVDSKEHSLMNGVSYAVAKGQGITVPAKGHKSFGAIAVVGELSDRMNPPIDSQSPIMLLKPGEHTIRIKVSDARIKENKLGEVAAATVKVNVQPDSGPTTHVYKKVGELPIKADVYRLMGDEVRPVIVFIHGGALITGQRAGINAEQRRRYLNAGFVVVSIDYRLAPETKLKGIIEDVQDAFKWVRSEGPKLYKIDPKRVGVVGHSAGGYLTLMSGFAVEPRPQALVPFYGYGDIDGEWYAKPDPFYRKTRPLVSKEDAYKAIGTKEIAEGNVKGRGDFYMYCRQNGLWPQLVAGHDPAKEPKAFDRFCPVRNVTKNYPPTLLLHGDNDTDVPHQQSVDMAAALKKHGVVHDFISIKGGGHGFDGKGMKDAKVAAAFDQVITFLQKHTAK